MMKAGDGAFAYALNIVQPFLLISLHLDFLDDFFHSLAPELRAESCALSRQLAPSTATKSKRQYRRQLAQYPRWDSQLGFAALLFLLFLLSQLLFAAQRSLKTQFFESLRWFAFKLKFMVFAFHHVLSHQHPTLSHPSSGKRPRFKQKPKKKHL